jgi:hypothetical protein
VVLPVPSRNNVASQLEYRNPQAPRDVDQTNYGEFARLDPVNSQFPSLVELERIRVTLAFLKHHGYQVLLGRNEQETPV